MDLSDGLPKDLSRLCDASGVGARVDLGAVPVSGPLASGAALLGVDARSLALSGGEDYELLGEPYDVTPNDMGRIAAQAAKQVMNQRIRETEREMKVAPMDWGLLTREGAGWMAWWDRHVRGSGRRRS